MRVATSIRFLLGGNPGSTVDENAVAELPPCIRAYRVDLRATRRRVLGAGPVDVNFDRRWGNVSLVFGTGSQYRTWSRAVAQLGSAPDWGSGGRRFKSCQPDQLVPVGRFPPGLSYCLLLSL